MDIKAFTEILNDAHWTDYHKMSKKYGSAFNDFLRCLSELYYTQLPIKDFSGKNIVFTLNHASVGSGTIRLLSQTRDQRYGLKAAEDEIIATSAIESIDFNRESVRNILKGFAPKDEEENRIFGIKKGLEFISDPKNKITEENIYSLYMMTVGNFLEGENALKKESLYRHDSVYVMSDRIEHSGLDHKKIPEFMASLIKFINSDDGINDLIKAAVIHFYLAYIHPYFDGNGRMARLLHLWFLIQKGYQSVLFIPFSSQIERARKAYYSAFTQITENYKYSGVIDVTPFIICFIKNVYDKIEINSVSTDTLSLYRSALNNKNITEKEAALWNFVLSFYGTDLFSTKQLEKDFGSAAYATIRSFVLKFEALGLLSATKFGARTKYSVVK